MTHSTRHPRNRAYLNLCTSLAEHHPDWTVPQVEAEATKIRLGIEPTESRDDLQERVDFHRKVARKQGIL